MFNRFNEACLNQVSRLFQKYSFWNAFHFPKVIKGSFVGFNKRFEIFVNQLIHRIVDIHIGSYFVSLKAKKWQCLIVVIATLEFLYPWNQIVFMEYHKYLPKKNFLSYIYYWYDFQFSFQGIEKTEFITRKTMKN